MKAYRVEVLEEGLPDWVGPYSFGSPMFPPSILNDYPGWVANSPENHAYWFSEYGWQTVGRRIWRWLHRASKVKRVPVRLRIVDDLPATATRLDEFQYAIPRSYTGGQVVTDIL